MLFTTHHPHHAHAVADQAMLMLGPSEYVYGATHDVLTEANLQRLYEVPMCKVGFQFGGETRETLVPVYPGLRAQGSGSSR